MSFTDENFARLDHFLREYGINADINEILNVEHSFHGLLVQIMCLHADENKTRLIQSLTIHEFADLLHSLNILQTPSLLPNDASKRLQLIEDVCLLVPHLSPEEGCVEEYRLLQRIGEKSNEVFEPLSISINGEQTVCTEDFNLESSILKIDMLRCGLEDHAEVLQNVLEKDNQEFPEKEKVQLDSEVAELITMAKDALPSVLSIFKSNLISDEPVSMPEGFDHTTSELRALCDRVVGINELISTITETQETLQEKKQLHKELKTKIFEMHQIVLQKHHLASALPTSTAR
ncbi:hypothetical protein PCE1_000085 [Barthelona sp. PCE]